MNLDKLEKEISLFYDAINKLEDIEFVITPTSDFDESISCVIKGLKICREYREKHPEEDVKSVSYAYFTLVKYLRLIFKRERMEFFKWMSDPAWVFEVDFAVHDFLTTGKIEDKWLASAEGEQGGFFKYSPDATIELVEMSRGASKTTKWSALIAW